MKLKIFLLEQAIRDAGPILLENVIEYLTAALDKIKTNEVDAVDLGYLTKVIVSLKIVADENYRSSITKDDVGINPNSAKELYNLLNDVSKQGNDSKFIQSTYAAIASLAPSATKRQRAELDALSSQDEAERQHEVQRLEQFILKVSNAFKKIKSAAVGAVDSSTVKIPSLGEV